MAKKFKNVTNEGMRERFIEELTNDTEKRRRGRKPKKIGPHSRLNADIPTPLYEEFQDLVDEHDGGNMTFVVNKLVKQYIEDKKKS